MLLQDWQLQFEQWLSQHGPQDDAAHDLSHFRRVWCTAQKMLRHHEGNALVVLTACYFHDVVNLPKNHPERHLASRMAADKTRHILATYFPAFPAEIYDAVAHAIAAHSFSAGIVPQTTEAKIVQDADRLESLGAIGLARVFYVSGALGRPLFDAEDPMAEARELDDTRFALDHFRKKLLALPAKMQTETGRSLARHNANFLVDYMAKLCAELNGELLGFDEHIRQQFTC
ncbi:hydrolase [Mangrovibacter sp. MFB070]|uniref:phosphohydrolase n=1 Tax=Mangrovibacter sp. MFB070 TaxID=1224318 RepID=UPI0004D780B2|nr:phosphohydrolase [Mangrovibacter sp. MFB070]KEA54605.1 hydrolase [Mangrovibacter sp. MFB070]